MRFIEILFGLSPDNNTNITELAMILALQKGQIAAAASELAEIQKTISIKDLASHELLVDALALFVGYQTEDSGDQNAPTTAAARRSRRQQTT